MYLDGPVPACIISSSHKLESPRHGPPTGAGRTHGAVYEENPEQMGLLFVGGKIPRALETKGY